jgi:hypothetical protein
MLLCYVCPPVVWIPKRVAETVDFYVKYFVLLRCIENLRTDTSQVILIMLFSVCGGRLHD